MNGIFTFPESVSPAVITPILNRLNTLENAKLKVTYFEIVSTTTGAITPPAGATILLDQFASSADGLTSTIDGNENPTYITPQTSGGTYIATTLDASGNYVLSGTPADASIAIIYVYSISRKDFDETKSIGFEETNLFTNTDRENLNNLVSNPSFSDSIFRVHDNADTTKKLAFEVSGITTETVRIATWQNKSITVAGTSNETFTGTTNFSGQILASSGTVSAPAYSFTANSNSGFYTTGSDIRLSGGGALRLTMSTSSGNTTTGATAAGTYRHTNSGTDISLGSNSFMIDPASSFSGGNAFSFNSTDGFVFTRANGTRRIARASIALTNNTDTAGGETSDLVFYTKPSGGAIAEAVRISGAGQLFVSASTTTRASLNLPSGTAPTSPVDGDIWSNGSDVLVRLGGVTYTLTKS
jgi:hypothetical protein